jgi:FKBP-type peptidyl-prolyl cis-trans isomerase
MLALTGSRVRVPRTDNDNHRRRQHVTNRLSQSKSVRIAALIALLAVAASAMTACSSAAPSATSTTAPAEATAPSTTTAPADVATATAPTAPAETVTKLQIKDVVVGKGAVAKTGSVATVEYTGWLMDGTKFDSSVGRAPFPFTVGGGQVIEGWDKGVAGMKVGGTRQLIIPSSMGYGEQGAGGVIPPNATLKFEVKLLSVK